MKQNNADYQVVPYPKHRRAEAVLYRSVQHKPMIHGLIEVDVTRVGCARSCEIPRVGAWKVSTGAEEERWAYR